MNDTDPSSRTGRHMLFLAWIIALGLLVFFFSGVLDRQYNPNQSINNSISENGIREVVLKRNNQGHYVTRGSINGQAVVFLLDTGATNVSIPEHIAKQLGLKRGAISYSQTANGTIETFATRLDQIGVGNIQQRNIAAQINPYFEGDEILLGMSFLKRLELIQRGDTMTLRQ